jgi:predicted transcriptional regulator
MPGEHVLAARGGMARERQSRIGITMAWPSTGSLAVAADDALRLCEDQMTTAVKQRAHELIESLPDDATWQDLLYALELRADIDAGLQDAKAGRVVELDQLRKDYGLIR